MRSMSTLLKTMTLLGAAAMAILGCDNLAKSPTGPGPVAVSASEAALSVRLAPSPVTALPAADPAFEWELALDVTLRETAGVGFHVNFARLDVREAGSGTLVFSEQIGASGLVAAEGSNRVEPFGFLIGELNGITYSLPLGGRAALGRIVVSIHDDRGNRIETSVDFQIV